MSGDRFYSANSRVIPAGGEVVIYASKASYFKVFSANRAFQIALDDEPFSDFAPSRKISTEKIFTQVRIKNLDGLNDLTIAYALGMGEVSDDTIIIEGEIKVTNPAGEKLDVTDADTQVLLSDIENTLSTMDGVLDNILGNMNSINGAKKPVTDMTNATYHSQYGTVAASNIITSGTNTGGVLIHTISVGASPSSGQFAVVKVGGQKWLEARGNIAITHENIFIPAGVAINTQTGGNYGVINMAYEVL